MRRQAEQLVNKIKADKVLFFYNNCAFVLIINNPLQSIDFDKDWKLVTLWIGGNDLCAYCKNVRIINYNKFECKPI